VKTCEIVIKRITSLNVVFSGKHVTFGVRSGQEPQHATIYYFYKFQMISIIRQIEMFIGKTEITPAQICGGTILLKVF
jgi:hypothetical protein